MNIQGIGATLVGPFQSPSGTISLTLDGKDQTPVDNFGNETSPGDLLCNQILFNTSVLQYGSHQLTATLTGPSASGGFAITAFVIEHFL